jgi:hypothetical protein
MIRTDGYIFIKVVILIIFSILAYNYVNNIWLNLSVLYLSFSVLESVFTILIFGGEK